MTQQYGNEVLKDFNPKKVILPVLIGLGVVVLLLARNFDKATFEAITWSWGATFWIGIAFLLLAVRHYALMARIKILTGNRLSWGQTFQIIDIDATDFPIMEARYLAYGIDYSPDSISESDVSISEEGQKLQLLKFKKPETLDLGNYCTIIGSYDRVNKASYFSFIYSINAFTKKSLV